MERFKNILFASFSGKANLEALERANRLAMTNQAKITLVRVIEELPFAVSYFLSKNRQAEFQEDTRALAQGELDNLAKDIDPSLNVETRVLIGKPFIELIRAVLAHSHDLIIKPQHPTFLDSTDMHLLRKCPCPVLVIKPNQRKLFEKVLIAVDPDPSDPGRLKLHQDLLTLGISLAKRENGMVEVVHAWDLDGESILRRPRFNMSEKEIQTLADDVQLNRQQWLHELLKPYDVSNLKVTLTKGEPGPSLVELIEKRKPDIVVMGTVARTGIPGLLIGNTAEFVLGRIRCSVLTIKPQGFKTPVE
jgi:universal stress protein E